MNVLMIEDLLHQLATFRLAVSDRSCSLNVLGDR
jgi:hypothetical protein